MDTIYVYLRDSSFGSEKVRLSRVRIENNRMLYTLEH